MPIAEQDRVFAYTGNGVATSFSYACKIFDSGDLKVEVDGVLKTITTDYALTGVGDAGGGTVDFVSPPDENADIVIYADMAYKRDTDYVYGGSFKEENVENDFDRLVMLTQQLRRDNKRAVKLPIATVTEQLIAQDASQRAGKFLSFDSSGNIITAEGLSDTAFPSSVKYVSGNLNAFVALTGSEKCLAYITGETYLTADLDMPDTIQLVGTPQGVISLGDYNLTVSKIEAGWDKMFDYNGSGEVSGLHYTRPHWFGIDGDADEVEIMAAISSIGGYGRVDLGGMIYNTAAPVILGTNIAGETMSNIIVNARGVFLTSLSATHILQIGSLDTNGGTNSCGWEGGYLYSDSADCGIRLDGAYTTRNHVRDVVVETNSTLRSTGDGSTGVLLMAAGVGNYNNTFENIASIGWDVPWSSGYDFIAGAPAATQPNENFFQGIRAALYRTYAIYIQSGYNRIVANVESARVDGATDVYLKNAGHNVMSFQLENGQPGGIGVDIQNDCSGNKTIVWGGSGGYSGGADIYIDRRNTVDIGQLRQSEHNQVEWLGSPTHKVISSTGMLRTSKIRAYPGSDLEVYLASGQMLRVRDANGNQIFNADNDSKNVYVSGFKVATKTPANASDTGETGSIAWDQNYIYVCTAIDTWKRVAISSW